MVKKILYLSLFLYLLFPFVGQAQQARYFPDRLIIKYKSEKQLRQLRSKLKADPKSAVNQLLFKNGARQTQPLFPARQQQMLSRTPTGRELLRLQEVTFSGHIDPIQLAAKISALPGVEYAEPKYIHTMSVLPDDPQLEKFIDAHNFPQAWDATTGSPDVVIAIVDGGVGYTHPDLDDKLWVNQQEVPLTIRPQVDSNSDGTVTSTEIANYLQQNNGDYNQDNEITLQDALADGSPFMDNTDADNNNFTDDLFGWDFWASGGVDSPITSDNDPFHDGTDHGTHVAGIAAAETNNNIAVAGAGYNSSYMAVKTGGIPDDPSTPDDDESNAIGFGFEGIVYAAQKGADIINCSWGGGSFSQAEQDVINYAASNGALVVAAAGNESRSNVTFPSAYDKVVSVGSMETSGTIASYSNYGYMLDVLATGSGIVSTSYNAQLATKSGTSMATPVVSGLAALIKQLHPSWSAERIGAQIKSSASYSYDLNASNYENKLGHGTLDALQAVSTNLPGIKVVETQFINDQGNKLSIDEPGSVEVTLTNLGSATSSLELQLIPQSPEIDVQNGSRQIGTLANGDTTTVSFPMSITSDFNLTNVPTLRLNFEDNSNNYNDFGMLVYDKFLYDVITANNIKTSLAADGTIGFTDPLSGMGGVGFIPRTPDGSGGYQEGDNLLFEGGLMVTINGELYDAVRDPSGVSRDFIPQQVFATQPNAGNNGMTGSARFLTDADSSRQAIIDLETFAFNEPALSNVLFVKYTIQNPSDYLIMQNVYAGVFNDWDIGSNPSNNSTSFSTADSVLYLFDASSSSQQPLVAVAHLGPLSGALAIDNAYEGQTDSVRFGIYDDFTDEEKISSLHSGTVRTQVQNTDVSAVIASGPYSLNPHAEVTVGFVYAFGSDVDELRNQIENARSRNLFAVSPVGRAVSDRIPDKTAFFQNYPNPFQESTLLRIDLQQATPVTLTIFDTLGRKVRVLADEEFEAGSHFIKFNGATLSSGIYFAQLETDNGTQTIPMTLIK